MRAQSWKNKVEVRAETDIRRSARRIHATVYEDVKVAAYKWFGNVWSHSILVSGSMIDQKAKDMAFLLGREDFRGGSGWLQRFKERHEIAKQLLTKANFWTLTAWINGYKKTRIMQQDMNPKTSSMPMKLLYFVKCFQIRRLLGRHISWQQSEQGPCIRAVGNQFGRIKNDSAPAYRQKQVVAVPSECTVASRNLQINQKSVDD